MRDDWEITLIRFVYLWDLNEYRLELILVKDVDSHYGCVFETQEIYWEIFIIVFIVRHKFYRIWFKDFRNETLILTLEWKAIVLYGSWKF